MTTEHFTADSAPDIWLTFGGVRVPFRLAEQEGGLIPHAPTFLDEVVQEQASGDFGYSHAPSSVVQVVEMSSWALGAGHLNAPVNSAAFAGYSYSRGVDVSNGERAYRSLQPESLEGIEATVTKFYHSPTYGWYALAGQYVYQWSISAQGWVEVYDSGDAAIFATDILEFVNSVDTYLFLCFDEAQVMRYALDGETFSSTVATENAKFMVVRGVSSAEPQMWKIRGNGRISVSTLGISSWGAEDPITPGGATVTNMVVAGQKMWIFYAGGYKGFDGVTIADMVEGSYLYDTRNGIGAYVAPNGLVYFNLLNRLMALEPYSNAVTAVWRAEHPELNGYIGSIGSSTDMLYFTLNTNAGDCYVMKGALDGPFHTWAFNGGAQSIALAVASGPTFEGTNPAVMVGISGNTEFPYTFPLEFGDVRRYVLPREGYRPEDDTRVRFEQGEGKLYGSWLDKGALTWPAWLNRGRIINESTAGSRPVQLSYALDGDETETVLITSYEDGLQEEPVDDEVKFTRIRHVLSLTVADTTISPVCVGAAFDVTPNPPRFKVWPLVLELASVTGKRGGGTVIESYHQQLAFLEDAAGERGEFEDYFGHTYIVKCLNVASQGFKRAASGQDRHNVSGNVVITLVEIRQTSSDGAIFTWGESYWNGGDVWGPE